MQELSEDVVSGSTARVYIRNSSEVGPEGKRAAHQVRGEHKRVGAHPERRGREDHAEDAGEAQHRLERRHGQVLAVPGQPGAAERGPGSASSGTFLRHNRYRW